MKYNVIVESFSEGACFRVLYGDSDDVLADIGITGIFRRPASVRFDPIISRQRFLVYASKRITSRRLAVDKSDYNFEFGSPVDKASRQRNYLALRNGSERFPSISDGFKASRILRIRRAPASPLTLQFKFN